MGVLTVGFRGGPGKSWILRPEHLQYPLLDGVWRTATPETRQVQEGEVVVSLDYTVPRGMEVKDGPSFGFAFPQVLRAVTADRPELIATYINNGYVQGNPPNPNIYWFFREYPYPITEPAYVDEYRYTYEINSSDFPLTSLFPDDESTYKTDWIREIPSINEFREEWFPTILCEPDKEIQCGDRFSNWCCIRCQDVAQRMQAIDGAIETITTDTNQLTQFIEGLQE